MPYFRRGNWKNGIKKTFRTLKLISAVKIQAISKKVMPWWKPFFLLLSFVFPRISRPSFILFFLHFHPQYPIPRQLDAMLKAHARVSIKQKQKSAGLQCKHWHNGSSAGIVILMGHDTIEDGTGRKLDWTSTHKFRR